MKKLFCLLGFVSLNCFANPHSCSIKDTIFFSYTLDHNKVVELCKFKEGYKFTFGVIGRGETVLYRNKQNIYRLDKNGGVFRVINGLHSYTIIERSGGNSEMIIMERGDILLKINLDSSSNEYINKTFGWVI